MAAQNILFEDDGNNAGGEEGNKSSHTETTNSTPPNFIRAIRDVVSVCKLRRIVLSFLLPLFPFPVENEFHFDLEIIFTARNRNSQKKIHPFESRCLLLKFSHEIASVVFTGDCIFPEGTKLELLDAATGRQVKHGSLASAQVEIFLLNGDKNWTIEELNSHILMQKRGGKSRRDQNPYLRLEGGVVSVSELKFKHTPKHMKKLEMVRVGARIVDQSEEVIVKEAVTGPYTVKDKRLLRSEKRYPPSPTDNVWRLERIYRNGASHDRLTEKGIKTVEDFLIKLHINPQGLRDILGKSMSENYWKKTTAHAKTCNIDGRKYLYCHLETEQKFAVVFNVTGQVMWLDSGCGLRHFNMLSESQKAYAHKLVEIAFANWGNVLRFDNEISITDHLSPSPKLGGMSRSHFRNLVTVDECEPLEFQNTSKPHLIQRTAESNQWIDNAECSTSYVTADRQSESDEMSLAIASPGHSGLGTWGYLEFPNDIPSVISEPGDWEEIVQFLWPDANEFQDFPHGELGQDNYSAAETSGTQFHGLQNGETIMDLSQNQFTHLIDSENVQSIIIENGINANQQHQMNSVWMVPVASTCKGKYNKSWTKISSILKWLFIKRFVKHKKVRMTKKRKFSI